MQIQLFTIPVLDNVAALKEMNQFLRGHRILDVQQRFVAAEQGAYWSYSIRYLLSVIKEQGEKLVNSNQKKTKVDYKTTLNEEVFKVFSLLRVCRKEISKEDAVPAYAVFTDAELSKIAALPELLPQKLIAIKGIGAKKVEKYGKQILGMYQKKLKDEKSGQPNN